MDDDHPCPQDHHKGRRNTTTDLPPLRSVLGDVLQAAKQPNDYASRRSSWHGPRSNSLDPYASPAEPPSPYSYDNHYATPSYSLRRIPDRPSPQFDAHLRLPPLLYSPSSSMTESPLEGSPDPDLPSSREDTPDVDMTQVPEPPPMRVSLKRRRRTNKAVTVVPCMVEHSPEPDASPRSPNASSSLELSEPGGGAHDSGSKDANRTLRIEVSGTKDGKLVYELEIPQVLIKYDAPMPPSPYDPHPCVLCGNTFVSERHMNRHLLTHTDIKPYQCTLCLKSFARPDSMIRHKRNVHGVVESPLGQGVQLPGEMDLDLTVSPRHSNAPPLSPQGLGLGLVHGESDMESD